jgi:hypothetical protein
MTLLQLWEVNRCFVCDKCGPCAHREIDLSLAEIQEIELAQRRTAKPTVIPQTVEKKGAAGEQLILAKKAQA